LLLIIFLPAFAVIVATGLSQRKDEIVKARDNALLLVQSLAAQQEQIATSTKTMLAILARVPVVQRLDGEACSAIFREVNHQYPFYTVILATTPDGRVFAASVPFTPGTDLSDRKHIKDAIRTLDFSAGEYIVGRVSGARSLNFGFPVLDTGKKLIAVVGVGFNLNEYARFVSKVNLPEGYAVAITDWKGVRLFRLPSDDAAGVGKPIPRDSMELVTGDADHGLYEKSGEDGVARLYAFRQLRLRENLPPYLYMFAAVPKAGILRNADLQMARNLSILGLAALIAMSLAWVFGEFTLIKPINRLVASTRRFGEGELGTRTGLPHTPDELGRLAKSFDDMASLVEKRKTERERAAKQQQLAYRILEALNRPDKTAGLVHRIPLLLKRYTLIEAVGIRLRAGEDFPYFETDGFPGAFVEAERSLCARNGQNEVVHDGYGKAHLECLCGAVIEGRTGPPTHFFTKAGSFWTNSMTELMASASPEDLRGPTRDNCMREGYESIALIPLRSGEEIVGLLQLNDKLKDRFDPGFIEFLESIAASIGMALSRREAEERVSASERKYRDIFERAFEGIFQATVEGKFIGVNPALARMHGFSSPEEMLDNVGAARQLYVNPEDYPRFRGALEKQGAMERYETPMYRKDGSTIWASVSAHSVKDAAGALLYYEGMVEEITDRKRAEELLRESEERYRIAIENSNDGIVLAKEGKHFFANRRFLEIFGCDREEALSMDSFAVVHPDDRERVREISAKRKRGEEVPSRYEFKGIRKDGTPLDIQAAVAPVVYRGDPISLVYFRDITERKKAEEVLRESENKFRDLAEKALVGIYLVQDGVFKYVNSRFAEIHGYEVAELIDRKGPHDTIVPEDLPELQENMRKHLSGEYDFVRAREFRIMTKQGETRNVEVYSTHTMYRGKRALIGTVLDVTERKVTQDALRWKTAFLEALVDSSRDGILVVDRERRKVLQNRRFVDLRKLPQQIAEEKDDEKRLSYLKTTVKDPDQWLEKVNYLYSHPDETSDDEIEFLDGTVLNRHSSPVLGEDGTYYGRIWGFQDITERRQAEDLLKRIVTSSPMGIFILQHGKTQLVNSQFGTFTGYSEEEAIGMNLLDIVHPGDRSKIEDMGRKMLRGELTTPYEYRIITKSGETRTLMQTITPIHYRGERAVLGNIIDITDRKALESQVIQSQKLEAIGQLAAGIAHEINTPIQYVGDNINFLQDAFRNAFTLLEDYHALIAAAKAESLNGDIIARVEQRAEAIDLPYLTGEIPQAIGQSLEGVERVTKIVRAMKEFSHPGTKEKNLVDINKAIENTITVSRNEWKYTSDMATDFDPSLPLVPCLPGEFNQVILNIIVNAAQAMGEIHDGSNGKGTIKITTRPTGDKAEIRISDTGPGIPENIKSRIFDPFFTTKEVGKGTGQGLAIARSVIVDKHHGTISCETEVGKGTTFIICLPLDDKQKGE
jgi:PAS domain S-box-containing protein